MNTKMFLIAGLLVASFAVAPTVAAQDPPKCSDVANEADLTLPASESGMAGDIHLDAETLGIYEESNGLSGLQTSGGDCVDDNGETVSFDADTEIAALGGPPAPPPPPV